MSDDGALARLAAGGPIAALSAAARAALFDRGRATDPEVRATVAALIEEVRRDGDAALRAQARRFDGAEPDALEVPRELWERARATLDPVVRAALEEARASIAEFHRAQLPRTIEVETRPGVRLGRRAEPLRRVGVYAPGGRAAYPSSVLMGAVPARVAGVPEVFVCSPAGPAGLPPATVLAACAIAGADRLFAIGGAGAVAALALGTDTVPRVDKVVGPGNAYVTEAKRALTGVIATDAPAGPSEVLVIADATAAPELVAAELLAQAEHDPDAAAVLVATDPELPGRVAAQLARRLPLEPRGDIIRRALAARGALLTAPDLEAALAFAAEYAPEHLALMIADPRAALPRVRAAGTIFLGAVSSVAFGDYITGANHVLPTAGLARTWAGLSTLDFMRWTTWQELSPAAAAALAAPTKGLADAEGLPAHAAAAQLRAAPASARTADRLAGPPTRGAYARIDRYEPGRRPCPCDLSDNTNRYGVAPAVASLLATLDPELVTRYPAVWSTELKQELAARHGVTSENVATGCGSDDLIDAAVRAFGEPGDRLAYPDPTFGVVPTFARMNALEPVPVPLTPALQLDREALLAVRARLTYLCSPNNPTGGLLDDAAALAEANTGVVLLDEAYADFAPADHARMAAASDRLIVLRTFSKAFGLAGLRVGYAIGPARLVAEVEKARGPYKVGGVAEAAALAVLRHDREWVRQCVAETVRDRDRLAQALRARGFAPLPSAANFLLVPVADAAGLARRLHGAGIAVRAFSGLRHVGDAIRVSIAPWSALDRFLAALDALAVPLRG